MALKLKYTAQDQIPAELRAAYVERNGEWVVDVDGVAPAEEVTRLNRTVEILTTERTALHAQLQCARTVDAALLEARRIGIKPGAETDLRFRAQAELTLDPEGKTAKRGPDGKLTAISVADWVTQQTKDASHLFSEGEGTGAAGVRARGAVHTGPNPFAKATENWTEQARITRENPELAAQLKQQAARG